MGGSGILSLAKHVLRHFLPADMDEVTAAHVREAYAKAACVGKDVSCPEKAVGDSVAHCLKMGYTREDLLKGLHGDANMGLGCGAPVAIAKLQAGEFVVDLGSGGGFDCFLAADGVGPGGMVIGVDIHLGPLL